MKHVSEYLSFHVGKSPGARDIHIQGPKEFIYSEIKMVFHVSVESLIIGSRRLG